MNPQQRIAFTTLATAVERNLGGIYFIDGPGGTGKTFVENALLARVRSQGHVALAVATTGIAATLLKGGTTAHSRFKIPIDGLDENSTCSIDKRSDLAELLKETKLILWDEAVMMHRHAIEAVSRTLQDLRDRDDPRREQDFGGIPVCFCGDFRQILPVIKRGTRGQIVSATLKRSPLWRRVTTLRLSENMRLLRPGLSAEDRAQIASFSARLLRIGEASDDPDGCVYWDRQDHARDNSVDALVADEGVDEGVDALVADVFPDIQHRLLHPDILASRAILSPKNDAVADVNRRILDAVPSPLHTLLSVDSQPPEFEPYPDEILNSLTSPDMPPHRLELKVGAVLILLRNLDPNKIKTAPTLS